MFIIHHVEFYFRKFKKFIRCLQYEFLRLKKIKIPKKKFDEKLYHAQSSQRKDLLAPNRKIFWLGLSLQGFIIIPTQIQSFW